MIFFNKRLIHKINKLKQYNLYRQIKTIEKYSNKSKNYLKKDQITIDNKKLICFSSNDYLNLSQNPEVIEFSIKGSRDFGSSSGSSPLISGYCEYHKLLEEKIALFKKKEKAIILGSGYLANLALLSSLPTSKDLILSDEFNHASIIDGTYLSKAQTNYYPHKNMSWLKNFLKKNRKNYDQIFIISDALFSMDGTIINLKELYEISKEFEAIPIIDEAHSTGVLGKEGKGIENHYNCNNSNSIIMGTMGKALGSYGAFITASEKIIDYLINKARPLIFSTALPASVIMAAYKAIELIFNKKVKINELQNKSIYFAKKLNTISIPASNDNPIFPIIITQVNKTLEISKKLFDKGFYIPAIRPPSVPIKGSRLRITLSIKHSKKNLDKLILVLKKLLKTSI